MEKGLHWLTWEEPGPSGESIDLFHMKYMGLLCPLHILNIYSECLHTTGYRTASTALLGAKTASPLSSSKAPKETCCPSKIQTRSDPIICPTAPSQALSGLKHLALIISNYCVAAACLLNWMFHGGRDLFVSR